MERRSESVFDDRIANTNSASQHKVKTEKVLLRHEKEKKREYNRRIMNIENGTFTPLAMNLRRSNFVAQGNKSNWPRGNQALSRYFDKRYRNIVQKIQIQKTILFKYQLHLHLPRF